MNNKHYLKRIEQRKLNSFQEFNNLNFAFGASLILSLIILSLGYDFKTKQMGSANLLVGGIYLVSSLIIYFIASNVKRDILKFNDINKTNRRMGYLLIPFAVTGNFFMAIAGFTLIKKEKTIEYTLCFYALLTSLTIILVSTLNLFKEYVSNTFMLGMGILIALTIFYVFTMLMVSKYVKGRVVDKKLLPLSFPLILSVITGNLFAFFLGLIIISKIRHKDQDVSVEWIDVLKRLFRNYMAVLGVFVVVLLVSLSICSNLTFDYSMAIDNNYDTILRSPSLEFPFGTDNYGRCVF
ncbi:MAG: peptide/nickel transport system permease protein, partial [Sedimentibacter sp.]|nr:peptide/nickel transport system permease protein [Sedimentibacter sp.]